MSRAQRRVDSFKYLNPASAQVVKGFIDRAPREPAPWTPLRRPLREATIALVSSAGLSLRGGLPFDAEGERRNPWWGDPSYRVIPRSSRTGDVVASHLHIDTTYLPSAVSPKASAQGTRVGAVARCLGGSTMALGERLARRRSALPPGGFIAVALVTAACAVPTNTPAQDLAYTRWRLCERGIVGVQLRRVATDGRISFWHRGPADRASALGCLERAGQGGVQLPEPVSEPVPGGPS